MADRFFLQGPSKPRKQQALAMKGAPSRTLGAAAGATKNGKAQRGNTRGIGRGRGRGRGRGKSSASGDGRSSSGSKKRKLEEEDENENNNDEEIPSDDDLSIDEESVSGGDSEVEDKDSEDEALEKETPAEKRIRLASEYLKLLDQSLDKDEDVVGPTEEDGDVARGIIASRLRNEVLEATGKLHMKVADLLEKTPPKHHLTLKGHQLAVTAVVISSNEEYLYSGSKDGSIIKWSLKDGKKVFHFRGGKKGSNFNNGHTDHVLCLALTTDGKYLASGGKDKIINIWNAETHEHLKQFTQHRDIITGLAFRRGTHTLYSISFDRALNVWNIDLLAFVETFFGHQEGGQQIDCLSRERCLTCGGRDRTARLWKIAEESHLVFRADAESVDQCALINEEYFVTGSDLGTLALWNTSKKKPITSIKKAHGTEDDWICGLATLPFSDLLATGSNNGEVKFWQLDQKFRNLKSIASVPQAGYVNSIKFSSTGRYVALGVGQEHRLGRWDCNKQAKNAIVIYELPINTKKFDLDTLSRGSNPHDTLRNNIKVAK